MTRYDHRHLGNPLQRARCDSCTFSVGDCIPSVSGHGHGPAMTAETGRIHVPFLKVQACRMHGWTILGRSGRSFKFLCNPTFNMLSFHFDHLGCSWLGNQAVGICTAISWLLGRMQSPVGMVPGHVKGQGWSHPERRGRKLSQSNSHWRWLKRFLTCFGCPLEVMSLLVFYFFGETQLWHQIVFVGTSGVGNFGTLAVVVSQTQLGSS